MFRKGISKATLATLWVIIPILTTADITVMRLSHGLHTLELDHGALNYIFLVMIFPLQIMFALMGWEVMKRMSYFQAMLSRKEISSVVFCLNLSRASFSSMGHFVLNSVRVASGIVNKFVVIYIRFSFFLVVLQFVITCLFIRLAHDHFGRKNAPL